MKRKSERLKWNRLSDENRLPIIKKENIKILTKDELKERRGVNHNGDFLIP